jgi:hypothetical protein
VAAPKRRQTSGVLVADVEALRVRTLDGGIHLTGVEQNQSAEHQPSGTPTDTPASSASLPSIGE